MEAGSDDGVSLAASKLRLLGRRGAAVEEFLDFARFEAGGFESRARARTVAVEVVTSEGGLGGDGERCGMGAENMGDGGRGPGLGG